MSNYQLTPEIQHILSQYANTLENTSQATSLSVSPKPVQDTLSLLQTRREYDLDCYFHIILHRLSDGSDPVSQQHDDLVHSHLQCLHSTLKHLV